MTSSDLRWMVAKGFAEHGQETPVHDESRRSFQGANGYLFQRTHLFDSDAQRSRTRGTCFPGDCPMAASDLVRSGRGRGRNCFTGYGAEASLRNAQGSDCPTETALECESAGVVFGGLIVKRFRVPARNQETILSVFEEEGWAEHIHDPLPVTHDIDAPTRLHDANQSAQPLPDQSAPSLPWRRKRNRHFLGA